MIGKTIELLLEEEIEEDGKMWYVGHSREYVRAVIDKTEAHQVNDLVEAKVTGFVTDHLLRAECSASSNAGFDDRISAKKGSCILMRIILK